MIARDILELFDPSRDAFGSCEPTNIFKENGKREANHITKKSTLTPERFERHLVEEIETVGFVPIHADGSTRFGVLDLDQYDDEAKLRDKVFAKLRHFDLPMLPIRSKSGGLHLYWITPERVPASTMRETLKLWANLLGFPDCEVFPKQSLRADVGNWINAPFAGALSGLNNRRGFSLDGSPITDPDHWHKYAMTRIEPLRSPPFEDGPPCLQMMAVEHVPDGGRNRGLFAMGVYAKLKHGDDFEAEIEKYNAKHLDPPLEPREVSGIVQSLRRRDYSYTCNDAPCATFCNRGLCNGQEFGIGANNIEENAVILPSHQYPARDSAAQIFERFDDVYLRAGRVAVVRDEAIEVVKPQAFRSLIEKLGPTYCRNAVNNTGRVAHQRRAVSHDHAAVIIESDVRFDHLQEIRLVSPVPLLRDDGSIMSRGFNDGGVFVTDKGGAEMMEYDEARDTLLDLLSDFDFNTPADRARAFAMLITPALRMSGIVSGPVPLDFAEADQSQAGKTLRQAMTRRIYGVDNVPPISQAKRGGVGSLDESLRSHYLRGYPFAALDNLRGRIDSEILEAAITAPDGIISGRVPHVGEVTLDVSRITHQATSNRAEMTIDLANRSCIVRIKKRPSGYNWKHPNLLEYASKNQARFLGCVYAVVRDWIERGRPTTNHGSHDFVIWERTLGEICKHAGLGEMMKGHFEIKRRVTSPAASWLREVALNIAPETDYTATELIEISDANGFEMPLRKRGDRDSAMLGRVLGRMFSAETGECQIDDGLIMRRETRSYAKESGGTGSMWLYSRDRIASDPESSY